MKNRPLVVAPVDPGEKKSDLPEYDQMSECPDCHIRPETGFGLAGGGYGVYSYCPQCGNILSKSEVGE